MGKNMQITEEQKKEYARQAEEAAKNIKYAFNKKLAVSNFIKLLYLSI